MSTHPRRSFPAPPSSPTALVLCGHPKPDSFNHALAQAWSTAAEAQGVSVTRIDAHALDFEPRLLVAYRGDQPLEPDLLRVKQAIAEAAHIVVATPVWWGSTPAALKGLFDRVLLPGWAAAMDGGNLPKPGLGGRSGRVLVTMDAPGWYDNLMYRASARRQVARATLGFCGIKPVKVSTFASIGHSSADDRAAMLVKAAKAGGQDGRRIARRFAAHGQPLLDRPGR